MGRAAVEKVHRGPGQQGGEESGGVGVLLQEAESADERILQMVRFVLGLGLLQDSARVCRSMQQVRL